MRNSEIDGDALEIRMGKAVVRDQDVVEPLIRVEPVHDDAIELKGLAFPDVASPGCRGEQ